MTRAWPARLGPRPRPQEEPAPKVCALLVQVSAFLPRAFFYKSKSRRLARVSIARASSLPPSPLPGPLLRSVHTDARLPGGSLDALRAVSTASRPLFSPSSGEPSTHVPCAQRGVSECGCWSASVGCRNSRCPEAALFPLARPWPGEGLGSHGLSACHLAF